MPEHGQEGLAAGDYNREVGQERKKKAGDQEQQRREGKMGCFRPGFRPGGCCGGAGDIDFGEGCRG